MFRLFKPYIIIFSLFFWGWHPSLFANPIEPTHITELHLPNFFHLGHGTFTKFGFEIYQAHLYVDEVKETKKFAIILNYSRKIEKEALLKATVEQLERLGYSSKKTEDWKNQLEKIYPNINKGDHLTAIFNPSNGTTFLYGDKVIGNVNSSEFAEAFFGIWLSPKTSAPELRSKLLANNCLPLLFPNSACH
jgi:hypothetical protein